MSLVSSQSPNPINLAVIPVLFLFFPKLCRLHLKMTQTTRPQTQYISTKFKSSCLPHMMHVSQASHQSRLEKRPSCLHAWLGWLRPSSNYAKKWIILFHQWRPHPHLLLLSLQVSLIRCYEPVGDVAPIISTRILQNVWTVWESFMIYQPPYVKDGDCRSKPSWCWFDVYEQSMPLSLIPCCLNVLCFEWMNRVVGLWE